MSTAARAGTPTLRVAAFPLYAPRGASSRVRLYQFAEPSAARGITIEASPLFSAQALDVRIAGGGGGLGSAARVLWDRYRAARRASADVYWVEKELLPWLPWHIERGALSGLRPLVADIDDAIFHKYDTHTSPLVRRSLGRKIDRIFASATLVTAGNEYLAARARAAGAAWVEVVPSVVPVSEYRVHTVRSAADTFVIGWIGQPSTAPYLEQLRPVFDRLAALPGVRLRLIGVARGPATTLPTEYVPWTPNIELDALADCDVGIMPLDDTPWERGKCGYKLIQYLAAGLPAVASPVGVNPTIVRDGTDGLLATTSDQWYDALTRLRSDAALRAAMGAAGRQRVLAEYSLETWGPRVADLWHAVAARGVR